MATNDPGGLLLHLSSLLSGAETPDPVRDQLVAGLSSLMGGKPPPVMPQDAMREPTTPSLEGAPSGERVDIKELSAPMEEKEDRTQSGYIPGMSELIYKEVEPEGYFKELSTVSRVARRILTGDTTNIDIDNLERREPTKQREDAWRTYLGLPQKYETLEESPFKPGQSEDPDAEYRRVEGAWDSIMEMTLPQDDRGTHGVGLTKGLADLILNLRSRPDKKAVVQSFGDAANVMGNFTVGLGEDEKGHYISYYDKWDFDDSTLRSMYESIPGVEQITRGKIPGAPFEFYDRLYYDPETLEPVEEAQ